MPDRLFRTFGATLVLVGVAVAGLIQVYGGSPEATAVEIVEQATSSTQPQSSPSTTATTPTPPDEAFVYKVGLGESPSTLNFWKYYGSAPTVWDAYILAPTKASLYRFDRATLELVPELARTMSTPAEDDDGWYVDVDLKGGYQWSDGAPQTAHDIAFTYDTVRRLGLSGQWKDAFDENVSSVEAIDGYRLRIRFDKEPSLSVWPYGVGTAPIMAQHHWAPLVEGIEEAADLYGLDTSGDPAGGPLSIVRVEDDRIIAAANQGFRSPTADIVEYRLYAGVDAQLAALGSGEIHTILSPRGLTPEQVGAVEDIDGVSLLTSPKFGIRYLGFNMTREPMDEPAFRSAVALLVDRQTLASDIAKAPVAGSLISDAIPSWYDEASAKEIFAPDAFDMEKSLSTAMGGLKDAGYAWTVEPSMVDGAVKPGEGLTIDGLKPAPLTILTSGDSYEPARPEYAKSVASTIELLGFDVIPVTTDFGTVVDLAFKPDEDGKVHYDMVLLGWSLGNPALPGYHSALFATEGSGNKSGYSSEKMDELIAAYDKVDNVEDARRLLWEMETLVGKDIPYLPLYQAQIVEAYRSDMITFGDIPIVGGIQGALGAYGSVSPVR